MSNQEQRYGTVSRPCRAIQPPSWNERKDEGTRYLLTNHNDFGPLRVAQTLLILAICRLLCLVIPHGTRIEIERLGWEIVVIPAVQTDIHITTLHAFEAIALPRLQAHVAHVFCKVEGGQLPKERMSMRALRQFEYRPGKWRLYETVCLGQCGNLITHEESARKALEAQEIIATSAEVSRSEQTHAQA